MMVNDRTSLRAEKGDGMEPLFSLYLDVVRLAAALLVFQSHTNFRLLTASIPRLSAYGHSAVVVFFVLSGYVIAYVVDTRERDARRYAISRGARIYSVVVPALALALVLDSIGRYINPSTYIGQAPHDSWFARVMATLTFSNEPWGLSITAFSPPWPDCLSSVATQRTCRCGAASFELP